MEEQKITISLFNKSYPVLLSSFINLESIITQEHLKDIILPIWMNKFTTQLNVLVPCLYFILAIQNNLPDKFTVPLRQNCVKALSMYYLSSHMNFELVQYGWMTHQISKIPFDRCLHLIYFAVYGRLASKPFINTLIEQCQHRPKQRHKIQFKTHYIRHKDSRRNTNMSQLSNNQGDNFVKQLHRILKNQPQNKIKGFIQSKWNNNNNRPINKILQNQSQIIKQRRSLTKSDNILKSLNKNNKKIVTIPLKVNMKQNSSIMINFRKNDLRSGKSLIRRQKFNEYFNGMEKYDKTISQLLQKQAKKRQLRKVTGNQGRINPFVAFKSQKHPAQYFNSLTYSLKQKNTQLDNVREQCVSRLSTLRYSSDPINIPNQIFNKTTPNFYQTNKNDELQQQQNDKRQSQIQLDYQSNLNKRIINGGITRKNQIFCDEQNIKLFNKKVNNKNKIIKYKQQYRQFLKTLLFDKLSHD